MSAVMATANANPEIRFSELRARVDDRLKEFFISVWDDLASEPPEVIAAAQKWIDLRPFHENSFEATVIAKALTAVRNGKELADAGHPDPARSNDNFAA